jgi:hypothetical protein
MASLGVRIGFSGVSRLDLSAWKSQTSPQNDKRIDFVQGWWKKASRETPFQDQIPQKDYHSLTDYTVAASKS